MTDRYREVCAELAPAFAELPGLLATVWLADPPTRAFGGVYLFVDRESADVFLGSALFRTVGSYPQFIDLALRRSHRRDRDAPHPARPRRRRASRCVDGA